MSRDSYDSLLKEFGDHIELEDMEPDEDGYCCLAFNENIVVHIQYNEPNDSMMLFCEIGLLEEDKREELGNKILKADLMWQGTGGGTLGVDSDTGEVMMSYQVGLESMDFPKFQEMLKGFVKSSELWINALEAMAKGESVPELEGLGSSGDSEEASDLGEAGGIRA